MTLLKNIELLHSQNIEKTVFISYRREGGAPWALLVYKHLSENDFDVFFDFEGIPSGDFEQIIIGNIKARAHFLVILTPSALDRCNQPGDWFRREIETAIEEKRNIVPLFFDGFIFGESSISEKLTGELGKIKKYHGLNVYADYFDSAMEKLITKKYLNKALDAVVHPVSDVVQQVTKEQKLAADEAIAQPSFQYFLLTPSVKVKEYMHPDTFDGNKVSLKYTILGVDDSEQMVGILHIPVIKEVGEIRKELLRLRKINKNVHYDIAIKVPSNAGMPRPLIEKGSEIYLRPRES